MSGVKLWTPLVLLLAFMLGTCGQWAAPKRGAARQIRVSRASQRDAHPGMQFAGLDASDEAASDEAAASQARADGPSGAGEDGGEGGGGREQEAGGVVAGSYGVEFIEPRDGDVVRSTPFRVAMRTTGGFSVPEHGEIRLTMTYPGRGQDVRVLQSTEFRSWNVVGGDFTITAMLVSTKDEPMSAPTTVHVVQERGPHFVLMQPLDGQLLLAHATVPVVLTFGGAVPAGSRACFELTSTPPKGRAAGVHRARTCTDDADVVMAEEQGVLKVQIPAPAGNCTLRAAAFDADDRPLTPEAVRHFRVVEEQEECPPGSGIACLHGECQQDRCVCDYGAFAGRRCAPAASAPPPTSAAIAALGASSSSTRIRSSAAALHGASGGGAVSLADAYLHLVKAALLDALYSKDRPGETQVVARSMVGQYSLSPPPLLSPPLPRLSFSPVL